MHWLACSPLRACWIIQRTLKDFVQKCHTLQNLAASSQYIVLLICLVAIQSVSVWVRLTQAQLNSQVGEEWLISQYTILDNLIRKINQQFKTSVM